MIRNRTVGRLAAMLAVSALVCAPVANPADASSASPQGREQARAAAWTAVGESVPSHVVVGWTGTENRRRALLAIAREGRAVSRHLYGGRGALVPVPAGVSPGDLATSIARLPGVAYAEPDSVVHAAWVPDDPRFGDGTQWGPQRVQATDAWDIARGAGVLIAVVDTGVDLDHEDLAANIWVNPAETPGNMIDDDGNGFIDDVSGWDFVNSDPYPDDDNSHGTHCAGIAAAITNNTTGIAGMAPGARILPVKVLDASGAGSSTKNVLSLLLLSQPAMKPRTIIAPGVSALESAARNILPPVTPGCRFERSVERQ